MRARLEEAIAAGPPGAADGETVAPPSEAAAEPATSEGTAAGPAS
jgi:hypothetical protein